MHGDRNNAIGMGIDVPASLSIIFHVMLEVSYNDKACWQQN